MKDQELPLITKLISANRITVSKEIVEMLDLEIGDTVQVHISKIDKPKAEVSS